MELRSRLPEYGEEALGNLTDEDLYTLAQLVIVEQTARGIARMQDVDVAQRHRDQVRRVHFPDAEAAA